MKNCLYSNPRNMYKSRFLWIRNLIETKLDLNFFRPPPLFILVALMVFSIPAFGSSRKGVGANGPGKGETITCGIEYCVAQCADDLIRTKMVTENQAMDFCVHKWIKAKECKLSVWGDYPFCDIKDEK